MKNMALYVAAAFALLSLSGCASRQEAKLHPLSAVLAPKPIQHCKTLRGLPDRACTPGVVRTTDVQLICHGPGTGKFRPPVSYTNALKQQGIVEYGFTDKLMADYEEDHLISLELGGDGYDPKNLWPEPHAGATGSFEKDRVENWLHAQICSGAIPVQVAQRGIAENWKQYLPAATKTVKLTFRERH